jgi:hypothetical protein
MYPWSIGNFDYVMDIALDIALNYLQRTGQAAPFREVQAVAAVAIANAWKAGVRHRIRLANAAIRAVECNNQLNSCRGRELTLGCSSAAPKT